RRHHTEQKVVEGRYPTPICLFRAAGPRVLGGDGGLQGKWTDFTVLNGFIYEPKSLLDHVPIPQGSILILQKHEVSIGGRSRGTAGFLQQHQGEDSGHFRLGEDLIKHSRQVDGLLGKVYPSDGVSGRRGISLIVDEIDDV